MTATTVGATGALATELESSALTAPLPAGRYALAILRLATGFIFLWAFFDKIEFRREKRSRSPQDLVRPPQLRDLAPQPFDLGVLITGQPGPLTAIDLDAATPLPQRLRPDTKLGADMADRGVLGLMLRHRLLKYPERTLPERRRNQTGHAQSSIGSGTKPRAIQNGGLFPTSASPAV
jgi:hypothetical protein